MSIRTMRLDTARVATADKAERERILRAATRELVGATFYGPMLKMAQNSALKGKYGHGGRGEEVFRNQLDMELARRAGRASDNKLADAIFQSLTRRGRA